MFSRCLFLLLFAGTVFTAVTDFDDLRGHYEFIFHDNKNLLLTIHDNDCYHTEVRDNRLICRQLIENQVLIQIRYNEGIHRSSLQTMRNIFQDILADFHCYGKTVHRLNINSCFNCDSTFGCSGDGNDDDD